MAKFPCRFYRIRKQVSLFIVLALSIGPISCSSARARSTSTSNSAISGYVSSKKVPDGSLVLVTAFAPEKESKAPRAKFNETEFPMYLSGEGDSEGVAKWEGLLGVPYEMKPGTYSIEITFADGNLTLPIEVQSGEYASETLQVSARKVNPKKSDLIRIKKEVAELGRIYQKVNPKKLWSGKFQLPVDSAVTSVWGTKRVFNGKMQSFHNGVDLRATVGTPVVAPAVGEVVLAKNLFFTGYTVILDHGWGLFTIYAHLSKLSVKKGETVQSKQLLGLAGMTGRANGPHLHWGTVIHRVKVNPMDLMSVLR